MGGHLCRHFTSHGFAAVSGIRVLEWKAVISIALAAGIACTTMKPRFVSDGCRWFMLPNPLWEPDAPEEVVEHLLLAACGGNRVERSRFSSRVAEVDEVAGWVLEGTPGIRVVTGSSGTGKSAIVGRVVSLSDPSERLLSELDESGWGHTDPGEHSINAHIHAWGLTLDQAAGLARRAV